MQNTPKPGALEPVTNVANDHFVFKIVLTNVARSNGMEKVPTSWHSPITNFFGPSSKFVSDYPVSQAVSQNGVRA